MNRLCGYCRKSGHTAAKCELKNGQLNTILTEVPRQRKMLHDLAIANGIGAGALVKAYDWWSGEDMVCIIPSLKDVFKVCHTFIRYKHVKYSKKIISMLSVLDYESDDKRTNEVTRFYMVDSFSIPCYPLNDMSRTFEASFLIRSLRERPKAYIDLPRAGFFSSERNCDIISPSSDSDVEESEFLAPITLHERLSSARTMPGKWR